MRRFLAVPMLLALLLFAACGSGDDNNDVPTPAPGEPDPTAHAGSNVGPPPPVDPGMELTTFSGTTRPYTIDHPPEWEVDDSGPSFDVFTKQREGADATLARMQVYCTNALGTQGEGARALVREDGDLLRIALANISDQGTSETTIDGRYAIRWRYTVQLGAGQPQAHQWVYYVDDERCAWRIRMVVYGVEPLEGWGELFDRIAQTFHSTVNTSGEAPAGGE